jgi:hypothetical protein
MISAIAQEVCDASSDRPRISSPRTARHVVGGTGPPAWPPVDGLLGVTEPS